MHSERDIDDAIDHVVREMMSAEPRAGLRGRVLADLEPPGTKRVPLLRFAAVAALAGLVAVSMIWNRPSPQPDAVQTAAHHEPAVPSSPGRAVTVPVVPPPRVQAPRAAAAPGEPARPIPPPQFPARGAVAAANVAVDATAGQEALVPMAASMPPSARAQEIAIQTIQIAPLTIDRIVIAPIPPPR